VAIVLNLRSPRTRSTVKGRPTVSIGAARARCWKTPVIGRPNDPHAQLQAALHANGDAARPLPRLTLVRQKRSATDVTPSQMGRPRRFSAGPAYRRLVGCCVMLCGAREATTREKRRPRPASPIADAFVVDPVKCRWRCEGALF